MTYTGKLYGRLGGAFIDTGYHTSDVDELTAAVKRLEAESSRLREALSDLICVASMCDNWDEFPSAAIDKANKALEARNAS
jgi:predicted nuclease with TOPRIM domain